MVNGQEVSKVALRAGDKILIGQSVMEVVFSGNAEPKSVELSQSSQRRSADSHK